MNPQELVYWVRGTGLQIAAAVFVFGMSYRMLHLALLGRKKIWPPRADRNGGRVCARCGGAPLCCQR